MKWKAEQKTLSDNPLCPDTRVLPEFQPLVLLLRELMREMPPDVTEEIRYGIPVSGGKRIIAVISPTKKDTSFAFSHGAGSKIPVVCYREWETYQNMSGSKILTQLTGTHYVTTSGRPWSTTVRELFPPPPALTATGFRTTGSGPGGRPGLSFLIFLPGPPMSVIVTSFTP
jgi:hypothetical protein